MVDVNDLLFWGSITIFLNDEEELEGYSLIRVDGNYIPVSLSSEDLSFIHLSDNIIGKLKEGNVLYMLAGTIYLGCFGREGAYAENEIFVSLADAESLTVSGLIQNLEYRLEHQVCKKRKLDKIGEFYKEM